MTRGTFNKQYHIKKLFIEGGGGEKERKKKPTGNQLPIQGAVFSISQAVA